MDKLIAAFPHQIIDAIEIAKNINLSIKKNTTFDNVIICGMGGSGIGGKMVTQLFESETKIPLILVQSYDLPAFVNNRSLVIGSSYSGNTEETLSAVKHAKEKGATVIGISSGGILPQFCKENNYDFIELPGGNPPRSMLAFSMIQIIKILCILKIIDEKAIEQLKNSSSFLNDNLVEIKEKANDVATLFYQKQGIIYIDDKSEAVAIRAKQQINENSKQLVWHNVIPEMNHNEFVGWGGGNDQYAVLFLKSQFLIDRNSLRIKISEDIIGKKTNHVLVIEGKGQNLIEEYFYFSHIVDWASVYLAKLNKQDAVEVRVIDYLKEKLSNS